MHTLLSRVALPPLLLLAVGWLPHRADAATLNVPSAQYATIQAAINAASNGDTVLIADGTYTGPGNVDLDFNGRNITVTSQNGPTKTVIDCAARSGVYHRGFYLHSGETGALISGLTVENGYESGDNGQSSGTYSDTPFGGGMLLVNVSMTVQNCIIQNCTDVNAATGGGGEGGGIFTDNYGGVITLAGSLITGNTASSFGGGGVYNNGGGTTRMIGCTITHNSATDHGSGGGVYNDDTGAGTMTLTNCTFTGNTMTTSEGFGSAVYNYNSKYGGNTGVITLTNCTFTGNTAAQSEGSGVSGCISSYTEGRAPVLINDIVYGDSGGEVSDNSGSVAATVATHCDIQNGYPGSGNITLDPKFVNAAAGDLHLQPSSPCLGAGTAAGAPATDKDGVTRPTPPSIGAYELPALIPPTHAQILWNNVNGQASLWNINPDSSYTTNVYGPFSGYTARAIAEAPDGADWLLWTSTNGTASVWRVTTSGYTHHEYGPYAGYSAVSLSVGSDGNPRLLWDAANGAALLWTINAASGTFTYTTYGPFAGYTARQVASGPAVTDLLWTNTNGTAAGWRIAAGGTYTVSTFGPFANYSAVSLSVGPDNGAHLLWDSTSGVDSLWNADFTTGAYTYTAYGPFSGYSARAIATGPDGGTRMLWNATSGVASLWDVIGSTYTHHEYGPFSGWTAVAVSAGP